MSEEEPVAYELRDKMVDNNTDEPQSPSNDDDDNNKNDGTPSGDSPSTPSKDNNDEDKPYRNSPSPEVKDKRTPSPVDEAKQKLFESKEAPAMPSESSSSSSPPSASTTTTTAMPPKKNTLFNQWQAKTASSSPIVPGTRSGGNTNKPGQPYTGKRWTPPKNTTPAIGTLPPSPSKSKNSPTISHTKSSYVPSNTPFNVNDVGGVSASSALERKLTAGSKGSAASGGSGGKSVASGGNKSVDISKDGKRTPPPYKKSPGASRGDESGEVLSLDQILPLTTGLDRKTSTGSKGSNKSGPTVTLDKSSASRNSIEEGTDKITSIESSLDDLRLLKEQLRLATATAGTGKIESDEISRAEISVLADIAGIKEDLDDGWAESKAKVKKLGDDRAQKSGHKHNKKSKMADYWNKTTVGAPALKMDEKVSFRGYGSAVGPAAQVETTEPRKGGGLNDLLKVGGAAPVITDGMSIATKDHAFKNGPKVGEDDGEFRRRVIELVGQVMPGEIDHIDELIEEYEGRENELLETLHAMQENEELVGSDDDNDDDEDGEEGGGDGKAEDDGTVAEIVATNATPWKDNSAAAQAQGDDTAPAGGWKPSDGENNEEGSAADATSSSKKKKFSIAQHFGALTAAASRTSPPEETPEPGGDEEAALGGGDGDGDKDKDKGLVTDVVQKRKRRKRFIIIGIVVLIVVIIAVVLGVVLSGGDKDKSPTESQENDDYVTRGDDELGSATGIGNDPGGNGSGFPATPTTTPPATQDLLVSYQIALLNTAARRQLDQFDELSDECVELIEEAATETIEECLTSDQTLTAVDVVEAGSEGGYLEVDLKVSVEGLDGPSTDALTLCIGESVKDGSMTDALQDKVDKSESCDLLIGAPVTGVDVADANSDEENSSEDGVDYTNPASMACMMSSNPQELGIRTLQGNYPKVAIDGDKAVVATGSGYIVFFELNPIANEWERMEVFGLMVNVGEVNSVAISGNVAVIGAPDASTNISDEEPLKTGAVFIYEYDDKIQEWRQKKGAYIPDDYKRSTINTYDGAKFGTDVDVYGDFLVVGAPEENTNRGSITIFHRDADVDEWVEVERLEPESLCGAEYFGYTVSIYEDVVAASADCDVNIVLYKTQKDSGSGDINVIQFQNMEYVDPKFGAVSSIDMSWDNLVYSTVSGGLFFWRRANKDKRYLESQEMSFEVPIDVNLYEYPVSMDANMAVLSVEKDIFMYTLDPSSQEWKKEAMQLESNGDYAGYVGASVALSNGRLLAADKREVNAHDFSGCVLTEEEFAELSDPSSSATTATTGTSSTSAATTGTSSTAGASPTPKPISPPTVSPTLPMPSPVAPPPTPKPTPKPNPAPIPAPTPPSDCDGHILDVDVTLDQYPSDTRWEIIPQGQTAAIATSPPYDISLQYSPAETFGVCLPDGTYDFTIYDVYGDGICCDWGEGSYQLAFDDDIVASGGSFGASETKTFSTPASVSTPTTPTQSDCYEVNVALKFDMYPQDISWDIKQGGTQVANSPVVAAGATDDVQEFCFPAGDYVFTIYDTVYGDGMCCSWGEGKYTVTSNDDVLAEGGEFGEKEETPFTLPTAGRSLSGLSLGGSR